VNPDPTPDAGEPATPIPLPVGRPGPHGCPRCAGYVGRDREGDIGCINCGWQQPPDVLLPKRQRERDTTAVYRIRPGTKTA